MFCRTNRHSIEVLLSTHCSDILSNDKDDVYRIKARRRHIWEDALNSFKRGIPASKYLRVTFLGEPAVDAGGPLREFFRLLLGEIFRNGSLFCGPDTARVPLHNAAALTKGTFKYIGCMMGASLLNGGPAPSFFANIVADYILFGIERVKVKLEDVVTVNPNMHGKLEKVKISILQKNSCMSTFGHSLIFSSKCSMLYKIKGLVTLLLIYFWPFDNCLS